MTQMINMTRRRMFAAGGAALALIPVVSLAAKNDSMRAAMKYRDSPEGNNNCASCIQFVPGKDPKALGGCKIFPGDTEVSPNGWCAAWAKKV